MRVATRDVPKSVANVLALSKLTPLRKPALSVCKQSPPQRSSTVSLRGEDNDDAKEDNEEEKTG